VLGVAISPPIRTSAADNAPLFWLPALLPDVFELQSASPTTDDAAALLINLFSLPGLNMLTAVDGTWNGLRHSGGEDHRFWLENAPMDALAAYQIIVPLDRLFELRAQAVLRFWRALLGRPLGRRLHDIPRQTRERHILILRALDARADGTSYRAIAEALLGFRGNKADWESDLRKNQTRRLVADGLRTVRGGADPSNITTRFDAGCRNHTSRFRHAANCRFSATVRHSPLPLPAATEPHRRPDDP